MDKLYLCPFLFGVCDTSTDGLGGDEENTIFKIGQKYNITDLKNKANKNRFRALGRLINLLNENKDFDRRKQGVVVIKGTETWYENFRKDASKQGLEPGSFVDELYKRWWRKRKRYIQLAYG